MRAGVYAVKLPVDLDAVPLCEAPMCGKTAEVAIHTRCGCITLGCSWCRNRQRTMINFRVCLPGSYSYACQHCRAEFHGLRWESFVVREVPL